MAAEADTGRAGYTEAVYPPLPVHAVPVQISNTVSIASDPI